MCLPCGIGVRHVVGDCASDGGGGFGVFMIQGINAWECVSCAEVGLVIGFEGKDCNDLRGLFGFEMSGGRCVNKICFA